VPVLHEKTFRQPAVTRSTRSRNPNPSMIESRNNFSVLSSGNVNTSTVLRSQNDAHEPLPLLSVETVVLPRGNTVETKTSTLVIPDVSTR